MSNTQSETAKSAVDQIIFRTVDPTVTLEGNPLPAMTTMLYRVCDNNPDRFEEATRIIALFIGEALNVSNR